MEANTKSLTNNGGTKKKKTNKRQEESSERMLNEIEASQLSDTEFKTIIIRKINELSESY